MVKVKRLPLRKAMKHQSDYISLALSSPFNLACFMEMRLGKTLANIRLVKELTRDSEEITPILVVCPGAVIDTWERELAEEKERFIVLSGKTFDKRAELAVNVAFAYGRTWTLINYESLLFTPGLTTLPWFFVILDESTIIKNPKSKISVLCTKGFQDVQHKTILSGLPSPEGELDLFQQFKFLHGHFMGCTNYYEFRNKFFRIAWNGWEPNPGAKGQIQQYVHSKSYILTRNEAGIGSVKIREVRKVPMTADQKKVYETVEKDFYYSDQELEVETDHVIVQQTWLARIAGGCDTQGTFKWNAKVKELTNLLKGDLANQPVVVWFKFNAELFAVADYLKKQGIYLQTLTGEDSRETKKQKQEWFRTSKNPGRVFLCQIKKVAEYGVDMSSASVAINYSYDYSGQTIAQSEDRIVNPNKKEPLLYIYLVTENSIDEDITDAIRDKVRNAKMFMSKFTLNFRKRLLEKYGNAKRRT